MDVTIQVHENSVPPTRTETYESFFGKTKTREVSQPPSQTWDVHLTIIPTEEERAAVHKYKLDQLIVEEDPYTESDISKLYVERKRQLGGSERAGTMALEYAQQFEGQSRVTRFHQYFDNPFIKQFDNPQKAHDYVDKLKSKILPTIKSNIDHYGGRTDKESFTL